MPHYAFIVKALSPRDGGWVRWHGYWHKEEDAWNFVRLLSPLIVLSGDYVTIDVQRTIVFGEGGGSGSYDTEVISDVANA